MTSYEDDQAECDVEEGESETESETEENQAEAEQDKNTEHEIEQDLQAEVTDKKKRSWVWDHFKYDKTVKKAKCIHCKGLISCNKGSTSGMSSHINNKHKLTKEKANNQLTIHETINNSEVNVVSILMFISFKNICFISCNDR